MKPQLFLITIVLTASLAFKPVFSQKVRSERIDRKAVVARHNVVTTRFDSMQSVSVGNGEFAFTVDPTGLQTFPDIYQQGVSLGTQSQWGWHSFPNTQQYQLDEVYKTYKAHNRDVSYTYAFSKPDRLKAVSDWFRENPHRLHLGQIGFGLTKADGSPVTPKDLQNVRQKLDLWTGEIRSHFELEGQPVDVLTVAHQSQDQIAVRVQSPLLKTGRLTLTFRFPYGSGDWENAIDWTSPQRHKSRLMSTTGHGALIERTLDTTRYSVRIGWSGTASLTQPEKHQFVLKPTSQSESFEMSCRFSPKPGGQAIASFTETLTNSQQRWEKFWQTGGAIDLAGSTDPRAAELERRIVLSQYLTKIQCAGSAPPQETGLTYNSWYGKPHLEMHWWHAAHFAQWNRIDLLEKSLGWYRSVRRKAQAIATRQGFKGVRWPKMVDQTGNESPSTIAPFLIWQQPHFLYFAELCYRHHHNRAVLEKYKDLVFETADFMASYAYFDPAKKAYILGPGLIPAQERFKADDTYNPTYELAYWRWGLTVAQQWRQRLGLPRNKQWDDVLTKLSPLPVQDGLYLAAESAPDSYTFPAYMTDHPAVLGAYGFLPASSQLDVPTMQRTFDKIMNVWKWEETWGWDYPLVAMTAARLGKPKDAVDVLLMKVTKNTFLPNGHNYQRSNLRIYLPGNGGLLMAISMMCAGWDGYTGDPNPGFPKDGTWQVKWEGLKPMP
ncbi:hypothetical protein [Spirosoma endophyticum]|uniref:Glycosyl hydrolase family 65, N-terminal domain n=1 Tax=Spirosoma endophyticum TaxID=662367 RepID=A0A1I2A3J2_9BACT|nr:hypothetical protein [Spirosoma endophyticum]SFE37300.1 hypothetical protein SAMN05216167_11332 [Spirosoma endophyticum]